MLNFLKINLIFSLYPGEFLKFNQSKWCKQKPGILKFSAPLNERTLIGYIPVGFQEQGKRADEAETRCVHNGYSDQAIEIKGISKTCSFVLYSAHCTISFMSIECIYILHPTYLGFMYNLRNHSYNQIFVTFFLPLT